MVAAGILASRLLGLVRQRVFGHFFGTSDAADAFNAAFKIPNLLQNLFGEGVLSASFIPVYARLLAEGKEREARRLAGAVAGLLGLITSLVVALGVLATPSLIALIAPGFEGAKRAETDPAGADPLPRSGPPGPLGLVSRDTEQPPAVPPLLRGAGGVERGDDRGPAGLRSGSWRSTRWPRSWPGHRSPAAPCSSWCSFPPSSGWPARHYPISTGVPPTCGPWCGISPRCSSAAAYSRSAAISTPYWRASSPEAPWPRWPTPRLWPCCR